MENEQGCGQEHTEETFQLIFRSAMEPTLSKRYSNNDRSIRYNRLNCMMFMDTFLSKIKSCRGNLVCQVFTTDFGYTHIAPMVDRKSLVHALKNMFKEIGVPPKIVCDGAREQVQGDANRLCQLSSCPVVELEQGTQQANRAERVVKKTKTEVKSDMKTSGSPGAFWDYCAVRQSKINNIVAHDTYILGGLTPWGKLTGQPSDISALCEFAWYAWVKFKHEEAFPHLTEQLGKCLGPADHA